MFGIAVWSVVNGTVGQSSGSMDIPIMATVTENEVRQNIDRVKAVAPDKPVSIFLLVSAGNSQAVQDVKAMFGDGFLSHFHGRPNEVGVALEGLGSIGIDRVQLTEMIPGSHDALAPALLG